MPDRFAARTLLLLVPLLAALPQASNRPIYWMFWASYIFALTGYYLISSPKILSIEFISIKQFGLLPWIIFALFIHMTLQFFGPFPPTSILAALRLLTYACFFWLVVQLHGQPRNRKQFLIVILASLIINAVIAIAAKNGLVHLPKSFISNQYLNDLTGTFINRNAFAMALGMGLQVNLVLILKGLQTHRFTEWQRVFSPENTVLAMCFLLISISLVLTNSRMGVASASVGVVIILLLNWQQKPSLIRLLPVVILPFLSAIPLLYGADLAERFTTVAQDFRIRKELFAQVWEMIIAAPITGHGADSFQITFPQFHQTGLDPAVIWDKPHNTYLTNWAELGLITGSLPALMILYLFIKFLRITGGSTQRRIYIWLSIGVISQTAIHSGVDFGLEIQSNIFIFLSILGLAFCETLDR